MANVRISATPEALWGEARSFVGMRKEASPGMTWDDADYFVVLASHQHVMRQVVDRRPEFGGIELGLDGRTIRDMRILAGKKDHASRSVLNAACG
eukprot:1040872-Amphidinium_carterae.1